jgi:hypothetical protein
MSTIKAYVADVCFKVVGGPILGEGDVWLKLRVIGVNVEHLSVRRVYNSAGNHEAHQRGLQLSNRLS